jgi:hypothetical protein
VSIFSATPGLVTLVQYPSCHWFGIKTPSRFQDGVFLLARLAGRTHLEVEVLYTPGKARLQRLVRVAAGRTKPEALRLMEAVGKLCQFG